jgi:hypothetical protein
MDYGIAPEIHTDEWLSANGHSKEWLERWFAKPQVDKEAITHWLTTYKHSDPRLAPRTRLK